MPAETEGLGEGIGPGGEGEETGLALRLRLRGARKSAEGQEGFGAVNKAARVSTHRTERYWERGKKARGPRRSEIGD